MSLVSCSTPSPSPSVPASRSFGLSHEIAVSPLFERIKFGGEARDGSRYLPPISPSTPPITMATLFHALSGAVTGKVFLFDHTMNGWEVMEEVIRVGGRPFKQ